MHDIVRRGTKNLLRDINNSRVLQVIGTRQPISRAEIAKLAHLPPPTVTSIINDFLKAGLVHETSMVRNGENGTAALGRRPILLALNERAAFATGVKLRQDGLTVAITDLVGDFVAHVDRPLQERDPDAVLRQVASTVRETVDSSGIDAGLVLGVGIGMPGLIDHARGICRYSSLLGWSGVDVKHVLEMQLDMPVLVDNDVNMLTAAELAFGAGREVRDFLTVTIGRGIGLGIVVRGEIYRGAFGGAGEFGHIKTGNPLRCECGAFGCLEAVASEIGICDQIAHMQGLSSITIDRALSLAENGDERVREVFVAAGRLLGHSIGNLLNLFNPQVVVVTGEGTRIGGLILDPMRGAITEAAFNTLGSDTRVTVQRWGDEDWAQGAAGIVLHEMLKPPIYESEATGVLSHVLDRATHRAMTQEV